MTIGEAVSRLRNNLKEFNADSRLSNRQLWNIIFTGSLMYLERENRSIYNQDMFASKFMEKEDYNLLEGSCVPIECRGCRYKLPEGLENKNGLIYKFLGTPDMSQSIDIANAYMYNIKRNVRGAKGKDLYAFLENDYIYTSKCYPCLKILYIPKDGIVSGDDCFVMDRQASIPDHMLHIIFRDAMQEMGVFIQKPFDHTPNKDTNS